MLLPFLVNKDLERNKTMNQTHIVKFCVPLVNVEIAR